MKYLASPYSINADAVLRQYRYEYNLKVLAELTLKGEYVFSPIVHSHPLSLSYDMPNEFDFWEQLDYHFLSKCDEIIVIMLPEWDMSKGVRAEIAFAVKNNIPVRYIEVEENLKEVA